MGGGGGGELFKPGGAGSGRSWTPRSETRDPKRSTRAQEAREEEGLGGELQQATRLLADARLDAERLTLVHPSPLSSEYGTYTSFKARF